MGCSCSKKRKERLVWKWRLERDSVRDINDYAQLLESRRSALLSELDSSKKIPQNVVDEWIELTRERDATQRKAFYLEEEAEIINHLLEVEGFLDKILSQTASYSVLDSETLSSLKAASIGVMKELSKHPGALERKTYSGQNTEIATEEEECDDEVFCEKLGDESLFATPQVPWDPIKRPNYLANEMLSSQEKSVRGQIGSLPESPHPSDSDPSGYRTPTASVSNSMDTARSSLLSPYKVFNPRSKRFLGGAGQAYKQWMGGVPTLSQDHHGSREDIAEEEIDANLTGSISDTSVD